MSPLSSYFNGVVWLLLGVIFNRIKYILISGFIIKLGLVNLSIFYLTIHLVNEVSGFSNRIVSASYNRVFRQRKKIDEKRLHFAINSYLIISFLLGLGTTALVYALAYPVSLIMHEDRFLPAIHLFALATPFIVITTQVTRMLAILGKFKESVIFYNIFEAGLVVFFAFISISVLHQELYETLLWQMVALVLSTILVLLLLHLILPQFRLKFTKPSFLGYLTSTIVYNGFFYALANLSAIFIVGFYLGTRNLGLYFAMLIGPLIVYQATTSTFSMFIHTADSFKNNLVKVTIFSRNILQLVIILSIFLSTFLFIYPQETLVYILRVHVQIDANIIRILALSFLFRSFAWMMGQVLIIRQKSFLNMQANSLIGFLSVPVFLILVPKAGFGGAAWGLLILGVIDLFLKIFMIYAYAEIRLISSRILKLILIAIVLIILQIFILHLSFAVFCLYFSLAYLTILLLTRSLPFTSLSEVASMLGDDSEEE